MGTMEFTPENGLHLQPVCTELIVLQMDTELMLKSPNFLIEPMSTFFQFTTQMDTAGLGNQTVCGERIVECGTTAALALISTGTLMLQNGQELELAHLYARIHIQEMFQHLKSKHRMDRQLCLHSAPTCLPCIASILILSSSYIHSDMIA